VGLPDFLGTVLPAESLFFDAGTEVLQIELAGEIGATPNRGRGVGVAGVEVVIGERNAEPAAAAQEGPVLLNVVVASLLAQLDPQGAVGRVHGRENPQAKALEALVHLAQGGVFALGGLELDAGPAQADLLEEEQLLVAGTGWYAVG